MSKPASSLRDVQAELGEPTTGAAFAKCFAERYFTPALGALPKSEVDQLVFECLIAAGLIDPDGPLFAITRALNVTPNKAKTLVFQYQLRQPIDDASLNAQVLTYLGKARFSVDEKRLAFGVESPLVRAALQARLKALNIFPDISLSGEILRVPLPDIGEFLTSFLSDTEVGEIKRRLRKRGELPKGWLADHLTKGFDKLIEEGGKEAVKAAAPQVINWLASAATTIAPTVVMKMMVG